MRREIGFVELNEPFSSVESLQRATNTVQVLGRTCVSVCLFLSDDVVIVVAAVVGDGVVVVEGERERMSACG